MAIFPRQGQGNPEQPESLWCYCGFYWNYRQVFTGGGGSIIAPKLESMISKYCSPPIHDYVPCAKPAKGTTVGVSFLYCRGRKAQSDHHKAWLQKRPLGKAVLYGPAQHTSQLAPGIPCMGIASWTPYLTDIYMGAADPTSGSYTCTVSALVTEGVSPWPLSYPNGKTACSCAGDVCTPVTNYNNLREGRFIWLVVSEGSPVVIWPHTLSEESHGSGKVGQQGGHIVVVGVKA